MTTKIFNRYEMKFFLDYTTYLSFRAELENYMHLDAYNITNDLYTISNIYFDTADNHLIRTSQSHPKYKHKLRMRAYGEVNESSIIFLEIKKKYQGLTNKRRASVLLAEAKQYIESNELPLTKTYLDTQVLNEFDYIYKTDNLVPKLYLAYDRLAFYGIEDSNIRLTFDFNIRSRRYDLDLSKGDYGNLLIGKTDVLMEIKVPYTIPIWLADLLTKYKLFKTSFSKYGSEYNLSLKNNIRGDESICLNQLLIQSQMMLQSR